MKCDDVGIIPHNEKLQFNQALYYHSYSKMQEGTRLRMRMGCKMRCKTFLSGTLEIELKEHRWMKLGQYDVQ
jgi:hypothetical protein